VEEIFLIHHTHTDLGYTQPQPRVLPKHADYIARALDYCTETDDYPEPAKFRWVCEVAWGVRQFLAVYPNRAEEFFRRVREGRIELTAMFFHFTAVIGRPLLERSLDYAVGLAREHGLPLVTAMNTDVNGWAWPLVDLLAARGITYFDIAPNEVRALGVRPRQRPFRWQGPAGGEVLGWQHTGYMGNFHFARDAGPAFTDAAVAPTLQMIEALRDEGYPHRAVALRMLGDPWDNAPPGRWLADYVRDWNAARDWPKLRIATAREWFEEIEHHWPSPPELRAAAWPDWWADGAGSAMAETAWTRGAEADIEAAAALERAGGRVDHVAVERAATAAMFFFEHTWGAWDSTDDPDGLDARAQWNHKADYAYTAAVEARDAVQSAVRSLSKRSMGVSPMSPTGVPPVARPTGVSHHEDAAAHADAKAPLPGPHCMGETPVLRFEPTLTVFNPLPFDRDDLAEATVTDGCVDPAAAKGIGTPRRLDDGPAFHLIDRATGQTVPLERTPAVVGSNRMASQRIRFLARAVPGGAVRYYDIVPGPAPFEPPPATRVEGAVIENRHFRVELDSTTGAVKSILDRAAGRELVRPARWGFAQPIRETVADPEGRERISSWSQVIRPGIPWRRRAPRLIRLGPGKPRPFGAGLTAELAWDRDTHITMEYALYDHLPRLDLLVELTKPFTTDAEAFYHVFPLAGDEPQTWLEEAGGVYRPWRDQVPGSASDWQAVGEYFAVAARDGATVIATPDVPLVQVNGFNTGRWIRNTPRANGTVLSWVMNNYWYTNFPARQGGTTRYRYAIASLPGPFDVAAAARFARTIRQPLRTADVLERLE